MTVVRVFTCATYSRVYDVLFNDAFVCCLSLHAPQMPFNRSWCIQQDSWMWLAARELLVMGWFDNLYEKQSSNTPSYEAAFRFLRDKFEVHCEHAC